MRIIIDIDTNGAAFEQPNTASEVRGILERITARLTDSLASYPFEGVTVSGPVKDSNGNTCGDWVAGTPTT